MNYTLDHQPEQLKPEGWVPVFWLRSSKGETHTEHEFRLDSVVSQSRDEAKERNREVFRRWLGLNDPDGRFDETE